MEEMFLRIAQKHIRVHYLQHLRAHKSQSAAKVAVYLNSPEAAERIQLMASGSYVPVPRLGLVPKAGQEREKRSLYIYSFEDTAIMGLMHYALRQYNVNFIDHAYAFPGKKGYLGFVEAVERYFAGKHFALVDIRHFFDSIPEEQVVKVVEQFFVEDMPFAAFLKSLCKERRYYTSKGMYFDAPAVKAGSALSIFLANLYLNDVDHIMTQDPRITYLRLIDSVIILTDNQEVLQAKLRLYFRLLTAKGLEVHADKNVIGAPGEKLSFGNFVLQSKDKVLLTHNLSWLHKFLRRLAKVEAIPKNIDFFEAVKHIRILIAKVNDVNEKYFSYHIFRSHKNILVQIQNLEIEYLRRAIARKGVHARYSWSFKHFVKLGFKPLV